MGGGGPSPIWQRLAVAAAVIVIGVEVAVIATRGTPQTAAPGGATAAAENPVPTSTSTTVHRAPVSKAAARARAATTTVAASPPTTTVANGPGTITYTLAAAATVTVSAKSDSWIEVRPAAGGPILHIGTLTAGQSRSYPTPVWIRTGNPAALTVTAGTAPLPVPDNRGPIDVIVTTTGGR